MGMFDRFRRVEIVPGDPIAAAAVRVLEPQQMRQGMAQSREAGEAWTAYRCLGEVRYVTNQQARLIGRLDWTVSIGEGDPLETGRAEELMRAAFGDNVSALAERAALCLQVPGGYVLARTKPNDRDSWRVFSSPLSAKNKKVVEGADVVVEVRIEDPEDPSKNDSTVLGAMDTCRELILARAESRASSRNRTAQHGLLIYPIEGLQGRDAQEFEDDLQEVITAPLADERSTASVTPNLIGWPKDLIESWKLLDIGGKFDEKLDAKIDRLVRSLGVQMDAPVELLLGLGDSNHWSAWAIQEDNWKGHAEPLAKPIGMGFAVAIMQATGATGLRIEPDPGPLMVRRPTTADALAAQAAGLVSDDWTREQLGADETDAPDIVDPAVAKALDMIAAAPSLAQEPGLGPLVDDIRAVMSGKSAPERVRGTTDTPAAPASAEPRAVAAALRDRWAQVAVVTEKPTPDPERLAEIDVQAYDALGDLITDTADRALERLGAKARSFSRSSSVQVPADIDNARLAVVFEGTIPNADVTISETIAASLPKLDRIVNRAYARLNSHGVQADLDPDDAESARSLYSVLVADVIATLMQDRPADAATWQAARRVVAVAGGNTDPGQAVAS